MPTSGRASSALSLKECTPGPSWGHGRCYGDGKEYRAHADGSVDNGSKVIVGSRSGSTRSMARMSLSGSYADYSATAQALRAQQAAAAAEWRRQQEIRRAEEQKAKNEKEKGFWSSLASGDISGAAGAAWDAATDWDNIKTVATIGAFGACIVVSAGSCVAVAAGVALVKFAGDRAVYGEWRAKQLGTDLAWAAGGGAAGAAFARTVGGASNWRTAFTANAIDRVPAVTAAKTRVPGQTGVGGGRRTWVSTETGGDAGVHGGVTGANMGVNGMLGSMACGVQGGCW